MKRALLVAVAALPGLLLLGREKPRSPLAGAPTAAVQKPVRAIGAQLAGTVLAAPYQVLRAPVGGRVTRMYFNESQTVPTEAPLLKLAVGAGSSGRTVFALAPVAGDVTQATASVGQYLAAGTPYARLTPRSPVRIRVATAAAARLRPGDSLQVLTGPVGLAGVITPLTAWLPDPDPATMVLVLGRLGWPPGTAVEVVLVTWSSQHPALAAAKPLADTAQRTGWPAE